LDPNGGEEMNATAQDVEQALAGLKICFQTDGYCLVVQGVNDGIARVRVAAGPNARGYRLIHPTEGCF
jgi:hypothetical protein